MAERKSLITRRRLLQTAVAAVAGTTVLRPFCNFEIARQAVSVIAGNKADCASGVESLNPRYPFDAIAVPGAGTTAVQDGYIPSDAGQMRLEAAASAYLKGFAPKIILLNGTKNPEDNGQTEIAYLQNAFKKLTGDDRPIPEEAIIVENKSINTATNMKELDKIVSEQNIRRTLIITNSSHESRATLLACANEVAASSLPAESFLDQSPQTQKALEEWYNSRAMKKTNIKEGIEIFLIIWDPEGKIPTLLKRLLGP